MCSAVRGGGAPCELDAAKELDVAISAIGEEDVVAGGRRLVLYDQGSLRSPSGARWAPMFSRRGLHRDRVSAGRAWPGRDALLISAWSSFVTTWSAPRLAAFIGRKSSGSVSMAGANDSADFDWDRVDFELHDGSRGDDLLHAEKISAVRAVAISRPVFLPARPLAHLNSAARLDLPLIHDVTSLYTAGLPDWARWSSAARARAGVPVRGPVFESPDTAMAAAIPGQGVALDLTLFVENDLRAGRLVRLFETTLASTQSLWLVCRKDRRRWGEIHAFRRWEFAEAGAAR